MCKDPLYRFLLLLVIGGVASLAFPPYFYFALLFISFNILLFFLYSSESYKESFVIGWTFGFGYFLLGLHWINYSLLVDAERFGWLLPFAFTLIPAVGGLYHGVVGAICHRFRSNYMMFLICFICMWVLFEFIRANLFTGFPWLILGYALSNHLTLLQSSSLFGVYWLSYLVVSVVTLPFLLYMFHKKHLYRVPVFIHIISIFVFVIGNYVFGYYRLANGPTKFSEQEVIVVQPNIDQKFKIQRSQNYNSLMTLMDLTKPAIVGHDGAIVVWPEGAIGYTLDNPDLLNTLKKVIPKGGYLITGADRYTLGNVLQIWNSLFVLNSGAKVVAHYDKIHLAPFGEYIPLSHIFGNVLQTLTGGFMNFSEGSSGNQIIDVGAHSVSFRPLICYESLFANEMIGNGKYPNAFINITNDGWFRDSPGMYHHFYMSMLRSVEYGVPLIRSGNTGISAIVDAYGRVIQNLEANERGIISNRLPLALEYKTLYAIHGDVLFLMYLIVVLCTSIYFIYFNVR